MEQIISIQVMPDLFYTLNCLGFQYSTHAVKRMLEKSISVFEVEQTLLHSEIIQYYDDDRPYPSKLLFKFVSEKPIHVVTAQNTETNECIVITCYVPDEALWDIDFKKKVSYEMCYLQNR